MAQEVGGLLALRLRRPRSNATRNRPLGPPVSPLDEFTGLGFDEETALHLQGRFAPEQVRRFLGAPSARERIVRSTSHTWAEVFFFSSRRRHTRSVSAFLLNRSSDLQALSSGNAAAR